MSSRALVGIQEIRCASGGSRPSSACSRRGVFTASGEEAATRAGATQRSDRASGWVSSATSSSLAELPATGPPPYDEEEHTTTHAFVAAQITNNPVSKSPPPPPLLHVKSVCVAKLEHRGKMSSPDDARLLSLFTLRVVALLLSAPKSRTSGVSRSTRSPRPFAVSSP